MLSLVSFLDRLIDEPSGVVRLPHQPPQQRQECRRGDASVGAEKTPSVNVALRQMLRQRSLEVEPGECKLALE